MNGGADVVGILGDRVTAAVNYRRRYSDRDGDGASGLREVAGLAHSVLVSKPALFPTPYFSSLFSLIDSIGISVT